MINPDESNQQVHEENLIVLFVCIQVSNQLQHVRFDGKLFQTVDIFPFAVFLLEKNTRNNVSLDAKTG